MKTPKKLTAIFRRYGVKLRKTPSMFIHSHTRAKLSLNPLSFAMFEASVKTLYLAASLSPTRKELVEAGTAEQCRTIAEDCGFALPDFSSIPRESWRRAGEQAAKDYAYCSRAVIEIRKVPDRLN